MRELYIDSRKRKEPFGNSYTMFIQQPIKNITAVDLVSATVPNTIYNITNGRNIISVNGNVLSIPNGFYSSCGLSKTINALNADISMTMFDNEGKFVIASKNVFSLSILSNELVNITGFNTGTLYSNIATTANGIYDTSLTGINFVKSSNVVNMKTGEYLFLDIPEIRRPFSLEAVNDPYNADSSHRFAVIPLDVQSGSIKTFREQTDYKIRVEYPSPIDSVDRLTIRWLDSNGNVVNFNGVDENQIILRFHTVHKEEVIKENTTRQEIDKYIKEVKTRLFEETEKKPQKKNTLGKWFVILVILALIGGIYVYR